MTEQNNNWKEVRQLLEQIEEKMLSNLPAEGVSVTPADAIAVGMYWRCMSLYRGILLLLDNNQPEEALMLWRSLFTDSLRIVPSVRGSSSRKKGLAVRLSSRHKPSQRSARRIRVYTSV